MNIYGFPGQGSQFKGMGKGLFGAHPVHTEIADKVLGYSIEELCLRDPDRKLSLTQFTQPALYVVSALTLLQRSSEVEDVPDFYIGHSLGEYNALLAAGAFDFVTGLRLVARRGELMSRVSGGGMAAVIGINSERVRVVLSDNGLDDLDIANLNAPQQTVISGSLKSIEQADKYFQEAGAQFIQLNVSAPFHSRYMAGMAEEFRADLTAALGRGGGYPVIANATARPYGPGELIDNLAAQICAPVRWCESIQDILCRGPLEFVEVGPGRVLRGLVDKIVEHGVNRNIAPEAGGVTPSQKSEAAIVQLPSRRMRPQASHEIKGRLSGKVALVTGGTSGIGAATVSRFVSEGARVVAVGRNATSGMALQHQLGEQMRFIEADVSTESGVAMVINEAAAWGGRLDIVFNNAGGIAPGTVEDFTTEDFDFAINLILGSVVFGIKHAAPIMKRQGWGAIISNSSIAGLRTHAGGYLYSLAKAAVSHATRLAGMELGKYGVSVNCVSPGAVATPMYVGGSRVAAHIPPEKLDAIMLKVSESLAHATPVARAGTTEDIAAAVTFLASEEGHYINCHDLVIDGGLVAAARGNFGADQDFNPLAFSRFSPRRSS